MLIGVISNCLQAQNEVISYLHYSYGFEVVVFGNDNCGELSGLGATMFDSEVQLLDFCTARWREKFVMGLPLAMKEGCCYDCLEMWQSQLAFFRKRPFFVCIGIEAISPVKGMRDEIPWCSVFSGTDVIIVKGTNGESNFNPNSNSNYIDSKLANVIDNALISSSLLDNILRPSWDRYFLQLAELASRRSNCMKRRVGAILARDHRVISTGYNGTPGGLPNCNEGGCDRCNNPLNEGNACGQNLDSCLCLHAEENALLEAGNSRSTGATLYCCTCPCLGCAKKIVQAKVIRVVYGKSYGGPKLDELSRILFQNAGIIVEQLLPFSSSNSSNNSKDHHHHHKNHMITPTFPVILK